MGWDKAKRCQRVSSVDFNPPIPCGMGLHQRDLRVEIIPISIHPSRVGWDFTHSLAPPFVFYFNPPIPCGMGPIPVLQFGAKSVFQSTHPVWDGTTKHCWIGGMSLISIHPSRVGWDVEMGDSPEPEPISIHPSRVGWDGYNSRLIIRSCDFNPPIPCGMGLYTLSIAQIRRKYFNPPIPCGMGLNN